MASVTVRVPSLLAPMVGGSRTVAVEATTSDDAIAALFAAYPAVRVHIVDQRGDLRQHVLLFVDGSPTALGDATSLSDGAEVTILQSVAGGAD